MFFQRFQRLKLTSKLATTKKDYVFTKAFAMGIGGLIGGGISLYWKETYMVDVYNKELEDLEDELEKLKQIRQEKERLLREKMKKNA